MSRRGYLDWLRGISVLIMIEAHTFDAWTLLSARQNSTYGWAMVLGGFAAPSFLFLAGLAVALAAGSRLRRGERPEAVAALAVRRGLQVLGLAFLFRFQSWLISGGGSAQALLKVDILNIMGPSMVAAAVLWRCGRTRWEKALWLTAAAAAVAMLTPIVRVAPALAILPDPIEWYVRPIPGRGTFTLFPWAGFLLAGSAIGLALDAARTTDDERRLNAGFLVIGVALAGVAYAASFQPPIYAQTSFWTTSPTFFFVRLGMLIASLPLAYAWNALFSGRSRLQELGRASLFVYWIHVELAYGVLSGPWHKSLTLGQAFVAYVLFSVAMFGAVKARDQIVEWWKTGRLQPSGAL